MWGASQPISNNSALIADSAGQIGTIYCHSASEQPHIGRWTSPAGNDITFTSTDAFNIGLHSGSFHSYTTLELSNGFSLSDTDQGVYSCQIPDENGIQNTFILAYIRMDMQVIKSKSKKCTSERNELSENILA